jgi:hypothetical protein
MILKMLAFILLFAVAAAQNGKPQPPKYWDLSVGKCAQNETVKWRPNCMQLQKYDWNTYNLIPMKGWGVPFDGKNCTSWHDFNVTKLMFILPELNRHFHMCGACDGNCSTIEPHDLGNKFSWQTSWYNYGSCTGMSIETYFTTALLAFTRTEAKNMYSCCGLDDCHVPIHTDLSWYGKCYWPAVGWPNRKKYIKR